MHISTEILQVQKREQKFRVILDLAERLRGLTTEARYFWMVLI